MVFTMEMKKLIPTILIVIIAILMVTVVLGSVQAVDAAPKKVKVTWNANGGKIGTAKTKVTTVKKNAKVGKLFKEPKRTGYTFKGWYTKKSGGKKITTVTKVTKKITYHAQWKKKTNTKSNVDSKLAGSWYHNTYDAPSLVTLFSRESYEFKNDGKFYYLTVGRYPAGISGNYKVSGGKITFTNLLRTDAEKITKKIPDRVAEYKILTVDGKDQLRVANIDNNYYTYFPYDGLWDYWYRI